MTDVDMFLITTLTNGLICSLCVRDMNDPNENNEDDFISDWGYANYCKKPVLKNSKYFMIIRHLGGEHFDIFYDKMRNTYLYSTDDYSNPTSAISIISKLMSPRHFYYLSGKTTTKTWDEIYGLSKSAPRKPIPENFFTNEENQIVKFNDWCNETIDNNHQLFVHVANKFPWIITREQDMLPFNEKWIGREKINNTMVVEFLKKNKNVFFKIIFNRLKFEEDKNVNIDMVGYVKFDEKKINLFISILMDYIS